MLNEVIRRATKGDRASMDELFALGERLANEEQFEDSANAFRNAAIAYRIQAFRNRTRAQDAGRRVEKMARLGKTLARWVENNSRGISEYPKHVEGLKFEHVSHLLSAIADEGKFADVFYYLNKTLHKYGVGSHRYDYPRAQNLVGMIFGVRDERDKRRLPTSFPLEKYLTYPSIRVGVDLLADEVERLYYVRKNVIYYSTRARK